ncbi:MAG: GPW/gp25 family protein [Pyrinomonadaceae bacterium]
MSNATPFLGQGWAFPPEFTSGGYDAVMAADIEDIKQSLEILFGTRLNERIMQEDYGCNLDEFMFEETSSETLNRLEYIIKEAVLYHEVRIDLNNLQFDLEREKEGVLLIQLDFTVPASNSRYNMVYPFYLNEGEG